MKLPTFSRALLAAALAGGVVSVVPATSAQAADLSATLVATRSTTTGGWASVPAPDPIGITWDSTRKRLVISDSEVEEMPNLYKGTNIFFSGLDGTRLSPAAGWTTVPQSNEPTGISYQNDNRIWVSDDDKDRIFLFNPGADGVWNSSDPAPFSFSTRPLGGDSEDVTVDLDTGPSGHVFIVDGTNAAVYDYAAGPNGRFDGPPGTGDDVVTKLDVSQYGAVDPEGVEYYPERDSLLVLSGKMKTIYEITRKGALLNRISIAAAGSHKAAGLTLAPPSNNPNGASTSLYIVDRGVDNNSDPNENDGKFYEMTMNLPPLPGTTTNRAPVVNAGPDTTATTGVTKALAGSASDPDGQSVSTTWTQTSGPAGSTANIANPSSPTSNVTFPAPGTYVLQLTGTDGQLSATPDSVTYTVSDATTPPANRAPVVNAGPDTTATTGVTKALAGSASDPDGQSVSTTWTQTSGPAGSTANIANPSSPTSNVTFPAPGTYVLQLTGTDGQLSATPDSVTYTVSNATTGGTVVKVDFPVRASVDDAEEKPSGTVGVTSGDLNLAYDATYAQTEAMRFANVTVPKGATITKAYVQFQVDEVQTGPSNVTFFGEATDSALSFSTTAKNITNRPRTAGVTFSFAAWPTLAERGPAQQTADLSSIISTITSRTGWASGNALALIVTGTGERTAESYDGGAAKAPVLHIEYTM